MPNIELHGFQAPAPEILKATIIKMFAKEPFFKDIVISIFSTIVENWQMVPQPFIRVVSAPTRHIKTIARKLNSLKIDIEILELKAFHSKKN